MKLFGWHNGDYFALLLLLLASIIGPEEHCQENFGLLSPFLRQHCPTGADQLRAQEQARPTPPPAAPSVIKDVLEVAEAPAFDRKAFLTSFFRQSNTGLRACLQNEAATSGSVLLEAQLTREGRLKRIKTLHGASTWPVCANQQIERMSFRALTRRMQSDDQAVQWRIDW